MRDLLRRGLKELRRSERGIALPMVLVITVVCMGFAAVPVVASINAQNGDSHNQGSNEALAAAEAGAEVALLKQSQMLTAAAEGTHPACVGGAKTIGAGGASGWCPQVPGPGESRPLVGAAEYSYQVRPCYAEGACGDLTSTDSETCTEADGRLLVEIVSTGYATVAGNEITKRIAVTACAQTTRSAGVTKKIDEDQQTIEETKELLEVKEVEVKDKEVEVTEKTEEVETVEEVQQTAATSEEAKWNEELLPLERELSTAETQLEKLEEEELALREKIEKVKTEPAGTEYTETPGETYYETTKTAPPNVWGSGQIVGIEGLTMGNNAQIYNGGAASNKAVSMVGSANVCGTVRYGTTFTTDNSSSNKAPSGCAAGRTVSQGTAVYPAVTLPSNIATENSDSRLCTETACHKGEDPVPSSVWERGNMSYNASNKQLTVNYSSLTLEGTKPYYLCQLVLAGGSSLYAGSGKSITIYFAPPSSCPGLNGAAQLQIANGTYVYADASNGPKFLFVGSQETPSSSKIEFAGGAKSEQFVVYAPYSKIIANNGIEMTGAIIGNTLELQGGASINKYGTFTPPAAETFLPSTETKVEKHKEGTKTAHPSKYLESLEKELTILKEKIVIKKGQIAEIERKITALKEKQAKEGVTATEQRKEEIRPLEEERSRLETSLQELKNEETDLKDTIRITGEDKYRLESEPGSEVGALKKQSFRECSGEPVFGGAPDEGC
jgi:Tfp pilus assembly protein PilX